jgi:hypothetical protein
MSNLKFFIFIVFFKLNIFSENFILITTLYEEKDPFRRDEYLYCLKKNIANQYIEKVLILYEDDLKIIETKKFLLNNINQLASNKIQIQKIRERPSFYYIFNLANQIFNNKNIIFANADIFYDKSLKKIKKNHLENTLLCITRYDYLKNKWKRTNNGFFVNDLKYQASFDTWIFKTPCLLKIDERFKPGVWGCEKFACVALDAGMKLANPCIDVKSYHVHESCIRRWQNIDIYTDYMFTYLPETKLSQKKTNILSYKELNGRFKDIFKLGNVSLIMN